MTIKKNESTTRRVRIYAPDLAVKDVIVTMTGEYIGTVESAPEIDYAEGTVTFQMFDGDGVVTKTCRTRAVIHIEIARRSS